MIDLENMVSDTVGMLDVRYTLYTHNLHVTRCKIQPTDAYTL